MKKSLILTGIAAVALLFASCGKETTEDYSDVVITINPSTLTLDPNSEGERLQAIQTPNAGLTLTWTSSDEEVVTVNQNGIVTPVGYGTATITASHEGVKQNGTCEVTVDFYAVYDVSDAVLFGDFTPIEGVERYVKLVSGDSVYCQLNSIYLGIYSTGIVKGSTSMGGAGFMIYGQVNVWVINDDAERWANDKGKYIGAGGWSISSKYTPEDVAAGKASYTMAAGKIVDEQAYAKAIYDMYNMPEDVTEEAATEIYQRYYASLSGAGVRIFNYNGESVRTSLYYAMAGDSEFENIEDGGLYYAVNLKWFDMVNYMNGVKGEWVGEGEEETYKFAEPLEVVTLDRYYEFLPAETDEAREYRIMENTKHYTDIESFVTDLKSLHRK